MLPRIQGQSGYICAYMLCVYVSCCRSHKTFIAPTVALIGHPRCINLTLQEAATFTTAGIHLPYHIFVYRHLLLTEKDQLISSHSCSRATKRNNSCVKYESAEGSNISFGILTKLVILRDSEGTEACYGLLQTLRPASFQLCHDSITGAKLGDHIKAFHPPMLVVFIATVILLFTILCMCAEMVT